MTIAQTTSLNNFNYTSQWNISTKPRQTSKKELDAMILAVKLLEDKQGTEQSSKEKPQGGFRLGSFFKVILLTAALVPAGMRVFKNLANSSADSTTPKVCPSSDFITESGFCPWNQPADRSNLTTFEPIAQENPYFNNAYTTDSTDVLETPQLTENFLTNLNLPFSPSNQIALSTDSTTQETVDPSTCELSPNMCALVKTSSFDPISPLTNPTTHRRYSDRLDLVTNDFFHNFKGTVHPSNNEKNTLLPPIAPLLKQNNIISKLLNYKNYLKINPNIYALVKTSTSDQAHESPSKDQTADRSNLTTFEPIPQVIPYLNTTYTTNSTDVSETVQLTRHVFNLNLPFCPSNQTASSANSTTTASRSNLTITPTQPEPHSDTSSTTQSSWSEASRARIATISKNFLCGIMATISLISLKDILSRKRETTRNRLPPLIKKKLQKQLNEQLKKKQLKMA